MKSSSSSERRWVVARSRPYIRPTNCRYSLPVKRSKSPMPSGTTPIWRLISTGLAAKSTPDRKSTRLNSSHGYISYAVFCLKKKKNNTENNNPLDHQDPLKQLNLEQHPKSYL